MIDSPSFSHTKTLYASSEYHTSLHSHSSSDKWEQALNNNFCFIAGDKDKRGVKVFHSCVHPAASGTQNVWETFACGVERGRLTCIWRCFLSAGWRHCRKGWFREGRPLTWLSGVFSHWLWPGRKGEKERKREGVRVRKGDKNLSVNLAFM